ncbi:glutamyl-trna synthetase [hydrocarbon metagenome]|uniref:glutamate--tRNA ligase n=1 Tax=hydrocarbon metagenome TaxID=938273 RepID=A0A0W8E823_9ZZZZ
MVDKVRVRFAPSPTGALHIGGARTALFNWLFARKHDGKMILRLEDSDMRRSSADSVLGILDGLRWLGLDWDEGPDAGGDSGPYRQSDRISIYHKYLDELLEQDKAYYCFCSSEKLTADKEAAHVAKADYRYAGRCRTISRTEAEQRIQKGESPVIRFKCPTEGITIVHDLIRGDVEFNNGLLDDFIISKSDGWPTYNFAVVVDDHDMHISHVIRAEEHLSNTPKQILLYQSLGWELPQFAHASMILAPDRSKLSKRHGATSVQEFRDKGYLPGALVNYLALLGWSSGENRDFWKIDELIERFDLEGISRSPAIYDIEKLSWMNGHYLSQVSAKDLAALLHKDALKRGFISVEYEYEEKFVRVIELLKSRVKTVNEILDEASYFFKPVSSYDEKGSQKYFKKEDSPILLSEALKLCQESDFSSPEMLEQELRQKADELNIKAGQLIHPIRLALSGRTATPGIFEVMDVLGKSECIHRIDSAILYAKSL